MLHAIILLMIVITWSHFENWLSQKQTSNISKRTLTVSADTNSSGKMDRIRQVVGDLTVKKPQTEGGRESRVSSWVIFKE